MVPLFYELSHKHHVTIHPSLPFPPPVTEMVIALM